MKRWFGGRGEAQGLAEQRSRMVEAQLYRRGIKDPEVLEAMRRVPRERFLPAEMAWKAYEDSALPIGQGQTISQPYIVARMTEALALPAWRERHRGEQPPVLDVGTGSGYQAAVLAQIGAQVVSIERNAELAAEAQRLLRELGYEVRVMVGDGSAGAPGEGPFGGILVAAAAPEVPKPLVEQLLPDGRLILPIGPRHEQRLALVRKIGSDISVDTLEQAVFVPLLGEHGFE